MRCPRCGSPMNHHADKPFDAGEGEPAWDDSGEAVYRVYTCPACGESVTVPAAESEKAESAKRGSEKLW